MATPFSIRLLRLSDLDRILEIERASFGEDAYDRNLFADFYHKCGDLFLVAVRGRKVCGYMVTCIGGRAAPPTRRTGVGSRGSEAARAKESPRP